jgi:imidazolonepropionase-like amidohydrolase
MGQKHRSLLSFTLYLLLFSTAAFAQTETIAFTHARIIDGTGRPPNENSTLVIHGGKIVSVNEKPPKGARLIDSHGKTIIPGLISAHSHLGLVQGMKVDSANSTRENIESQLAQYVRYGVTSVCSLGANKDLTYEIRKAHPAVFTAGRGIGVPNGAPPFKLDSDQVYRPSTPEEAHANVQEYAAHRPDLVKIWVDDLSGTVPKMDPAIYKTVITEAHNAGLRVAAHVYYLADAKALMEAGVDVLAHSVRDTAVDWDLISKMKRKGTPYIPTLELDESFFIYADKPAWLQDPFLARGLSPELRNQLSDPEWRTKVQIDPKIQRNRDAEKTAAGNLKKLRDAGATIGFGTDSGATPLRIPGFAEHRELELMVASGLTPLEALVAATKTSATILWTRDRGALETGKRADFVVLDANPLEDIRNTRKIASVWLGGQQVKQELPK